MRIYVSLGRPLARGEGLLVPARLGQRGRLLGTLVLAIGVALSLLACGGDDNPSAGVEIRPIEEILVGDIRVIDVSSSGAVVQVETSEPVVCSVVFGEDESYGNQATDMDMAGGAHSQHSAVLRGLDPDTEYHYRLQGSDSSGALYMSEDMTFRTAADDGSSATGDNLAASAAGARIIDASSTFGDSASWSAENAIDGDASTEWSSDGDGDAAFIEVELAEPAEIAAVGVWSRTMGTSAEITRFRVITDTGETLGPFDLPGASGMHVFLANVTASRLRFEAVSSTGGNTGFVEVATYAPE